MPTKKGEEIVLLDEVEKALLDPTAKLSVIEEQDAEAVQRSIIQSILDSSDPLHRAETVGGRDLIGVPLRVKSVQWRNSDFEGEGLGIFAVMNAQRQDGSEVVVTTGSRNVLAQLYRLAKDGNIPFDAAFNESTTGSGYKVLWLEAAKWEAGGF
jgi:hypothetical protein